MLTANTRVTWSLRRDSNARPSPYRGDALSTGATKARAGEARFWDAHLRLQRPAGCRLPIPSGAACRSRTCCLGGTGSALSPDELTRHAYPAPDSNRHYRPPQRRASCHWASWAWSLWTASNRLPSPYEGDALPDELQRHGSGSWGRTNIARFRAWNPAIERSRIKCGRCDLNAHAARSELARSAGCLHSRMVRRQGLEPRLRHRLRACRFTIELAARRAVPGSRTPVICLEGKCLPVRPVRRGESRRYRTFLLQVFGPALIRLS